MSTIGVPSRIKPSKERAKGHLTTSSVGLILVLFTLMDTVSCKWTPSNGNLVSGKGEPVYDEPQGDDENAEFGWDVSSDNVEFYEAVHSLDLEEIVKAFENASNQSQVTLPLGNQRLKRSNRPSIHRTTVRDNRKQVSTSIEAQMLPYAASVLISSGCSGTLIGQKYVLTAAHCAYSGEKRTKKRKLKVGFLQRDGKVRYRKVRRVYSPPKWRTLEKNDKNRVKHDYAVLELKREQRRSFIKPVPYHKTRSVLLFNGFPGDKKKNTMWRTPCARFRKYNGYLMNICKFPKGMSGAGGYQLDARGSYVVKGIVVASARVNIKGKIYKYNVVNPLTRAKTRLICKWIKAGNYCRSFPRGR